MPLTFNSDAPRSHLVIPDDHAYPEDNFRRYKWLGQFILERQPEVIITLGDRWDMTSLCSYEKGKRDFVFKNVKADIEAGHKAEALIFGPMVERNKDLAKWKKTQYKPLIIKLLGNHEYRVKKLLDYEPKWDGSVSMSDFNNRLGLKEHVVDFMDFCVVDGVAYSHYFASGAMGRPFSSARAMLQKRGMSCTMGHTHILDYASNTKPTGERMMGLVAGSFHDADHKSFAGSQVDALWFNGLIYKHGVKDGEYDLEEVSIKRLENMYGKK